MRYAVTHTDSQRQPHRIFFYAPISAWSLRALILPSHSNTFVMMCANSQGTAHSIQSAYAYQYVSRKKKTHKFVCKLQIALTCSLVFCRIVRPPVVAVFVFSSRLLYYFIGYDRLSRRPGARRLICRSMNSNYVEIGIKLFFFTFYSFFIPFRLRRAQRTFFRFILAGHTTSLFNHDYFYRVVNVHSPHTRIHTHTRRAYITPCHVTADRTSRMLSQFICSRAINQFSRRPLQFFDIFVWPMTAIVFTFGHTKMRDECQQIITKMLEYSFLFPFFRHNGPNRIAPKWIFAVEFHSWNLFCLEKLWNIVNTSFSVFRSLGPFMFVE